jgi:hypothetical protein
VPFLNMTQITRLSKEIKKSFPKGGGKAEDNIFIGCPHIHIVGSMYPEVEGCTLCIKKESINESSLGFLQSIVDKKGLKMTLMSNNYFMIYTPKTLNNK